MLIGDRKRAWLSLAAALMMNNVCTVYFGTDRTNIVYSLCFAEEKLHMNTFMGYVKKHKEYNLLLLFLYNMW